MKPNPGGQLAPDQIVGRDDFITKMWDTLEGRSIYMNDLRRVGKTEILRKMESAPRSGFVVVKRDVGGCHSAAEFATQAYQDSLDLLSTKTKTLRKMADLLRDIGGTQLGSFIKLPDGKPAPWKEILRRTFCDLEEELTKLDCLIVFLWDEIPFLLDNVSKREGAQTAEEILDMLRSLSQDHPHIRMVLTGSIGLHHILATLRTNGYAHSPLNHMERVAPGPLDPVAAEQLARDLLTGAGLTCNDLPQCSRELSAAVGHVAFYIHKLISRLPKQIITVAVIEKTLLEELLHPDNDWDLAHYRTRIPTYYGVCENAVLHILDAVAVADAPLSFDSIFKEISSRSDFGDAERLHELLRLLQQDHYLSHDCAGYTFRYPLIRRWWLVDRDL